MEKFFCISLYQRLLTGLIFVFTFFITLLLFPTLFTILNLIILLIILTFELPKLINPKRPKFWMTAAFYPTISFLLIIFLNTTKTRFLLFWMFVLVFTFDTGSYIIGKLFGTHKICPKISPGKTIEGFFGGYFFVCLIFFIFFSNLSILNSLIFTLTLSLLALLGDLFESYLKRQANVKDSGKLLPGHGGFLDRFDSITFVVIFFYIFRNNLLKLLML